MPAQSPGLAKAKAGPGPGTQFFRNALYNSLGSRLRGKDEAVAPEFGK